MTKAIKEIVFKGFDYDKPKTKALVVWVSGEETEIKRITDPINNNIISIEDMDLGFDIGESLGIDFDLPEQECEFLLHVKDVLGKDYS